MEPASEATPAPARLPVLPIRNAVLFPTISMPLVIGRPRSTRALEEAEGGDHLLLVVTQRVTTSGDPGPEDLHRMGTLCKVESVTETDTGSQQAVVTGIRRYRVLEYDTSDPELLYARGEAAEDAQAPDAIRSLALFRQLKDMAQEILELLPGSTEPLVRLIERVEDPVYLSHICSAYLNLPVERKQRLLEMSDPDERIELLLRSMNEERESLNLQREIRDKMAERLSKAQREALLREQIRTIRSELGEEASERTAEEIEDRIRRAELPEEAAKQAEEELRRLRSLPAASAEHHVVRGYLELLASMPWKSGETRTIDLLRAREILDEDHAGLETVKRRILQYLAVLKLRGGRGRGAILCLVGPPGAGKTSLGQSIARALGRKFSRTSLGGVRDEAEIRGHRRTYVGAMPGRIIQSIRRAGTKNPVLMLDEIDKLRSDFHGDPASAMLEVLDPEQNGAFADHYLDVPFDLSEVFFICTANRLDTVPGPLRDRMEIIEVSGYTSAEKLDIARRYLLPRELESNGLGGARISVPDETLSRIIAHYTREAGVRELQRRIAAMLRSVAEKLAAREDGPESWEPMTVDAGELRESLGPPRYFPEEAERQMRPGVATGLAWTPHGGDLLFVEASRMPGKGQLILTGQLGEVMKESVQIALSLIRSGGHSLVPAGFDFSRNDFHVHVPAGAIPKDGPSAGVTVFAALLSLLSGRALDPRAAMTGEITLRGSVLPVGGIKEKILAASRAELETVIIPRRNLPDLEEVPSSARRRLRIVPVDSVDEALSALLTPSAAAA